MRNLRTLGLIACEADRIGIRGSRSWSSTCAVSSVKPRLLLLTDFDKRDIPLPLLLEEGHIEPEERAAFFHGFLFLFPLFLLFLLFGKEETVHEPLMIPLSSILHHTRTHTRPLDASRKHTPVARPSTAEAHTINQQKGQGHQKARGRDKIFASQYWAAWRTLPFRLRHGQHATSTIFFWYGVVVLSLLADPARGFWSLWMFISRVSFLFPTYNNNKNNHSSCQPPPPPTHPRPPVLGSCQQQQQGASMGRTVSDSCWSATDPAGPAVLGSSTK